ncbi:potassium channel subfamily K member 16-like [Anneissia japonica]|uniref:potassium channel subfamily K member 16-like n=1 Tax=Anneissia japonica TaxID=1529436 RepID=UPI0014257C41|nr:potassium channel subfamily K member 16-like [Anneissia japonica]
MKRPARRLIVLLISFYAYLFVGGLTFSYCESGHENKKRDSFLLDLESFIEENTCVTSKELESLVELIIEADNNGAIFIADGDFVNDSHWRIPRALFFSATTITTIGYGYITPKTKKGQMLCIAYAFFGIPLTGWLLSVIGDMFEGKVKDFVLRLNSCLLRFISGQRLRNNLILIITCTLVSIVILILPSVLIILTIERDWSFIQAVYFSFITLSTIGFGDLEVASRIRSDGSVSKTVLHIFYAIVAILYLLLGLGVLAAIFKATTRRYQKNKLSKSVRTRLWGAVKRVLVLMELRRASIASVGGNSSFSLPGDLASRRGTLLAVPDLYTISENEETSINTSGSGFECIFDTELEDLLKTILQQLARTDDNHRKEFYDMINRASRT